MQPSRIPSEFELGHPQIDEQHQKLLALVQEVEEAIRTGRDGSVVRHAIDTLARATAEHYRWEEDLMLQAGFRGLASHKKDHDRLLDEIEEAQQELKIGAITASALLQLYTRVWVTHHIGVQDRGLVEFLNSRRS